MRGKDKFRRVPPAADGITPAYAGKRKSRRIIGVRLRDHPRLCGEKHHQRAVQSRFQGITPAYAGKSTNKNGGKRNERDHPRLCGEKRTAVQQLVNHEGSPPPMRGKGPDCRASGCRAPDHPRLCGEKGFPDMIYLFFTGSPPPMRGKVFQKCPIKIAAGITPAYAGKSTASDALPVFPWDHPRLCGEKEKIAKTSRIDLGSPPPMRGKAQWLKDKVSGFGITPAYAGKRNENEKLQSVSKDHPRLCGEKRYCLANP